MNLPEQSRRIQWEAVEAIGVIIAVVVSWQIGQSQNATQLSILREQIIFTQKEHDAETRRLRRPILAFDRMSFRVPVEVNAEHDARFDWPRDKDGTVLQDKGFPTIRNFGEGPALHIQVSYENKTPPAASSVTVPFHCLPGDSVECFHMPRVINDPKQPVDYAEGVVRIICEDTSGGQHIIEQEYCVQVDGSTLVFRFKYINRAGSKAPPYNAAGLREDY